MKRTVGVILLLIYLSYSMQLPSAQKVAAASESINCDILGSIGGPTSAMAAKEDYVYVGKGTSIIILRNTEGSLSQVGAQFNLPSYVSDLQIQGNTLYAAAGSAGLRIIDISNPLKPVEIGAFITSGFTESVAIQGTKAYLADGLEGMRIIDLSNQKKPVSLGQVYQGKYAFHVAVSDNSAYIAAADDGLLIADISISDSPKELATIDTPGIARNVIVEGKQVYVADDWKGVQVINISNPLQPEVLNTIPTAGRAYGLALHKEYLYVADAYMGLRVFQIHSISVPKDITSFVPNESQMSKVMVHNGLLLCADRVNGLLCFGINQPENLVLKGFYSHTVPIPQVFPDSLKYWDNKKEITRLVVLGILKESELNPEKEITRAEMSELLCRSLRVEAAPKGKKAVYQDVPVNYWAYGYIVKAVKLGLISSKDKTHFDPEGTMTYGEVTKCFLGLVNRTPKSGKKTEDYRKEAEKFGMSSVISRSDGTGSVVRANALAMLEKVIFEVTDAKTKKTLLESKYGVQLQAFPMSAIDLAVKDHYAYALAGYSGLSVVDISNPSNLRQVAHLDFPEAVIYIRINGSYAYVFAGFNLYVVDITDPLHPVRIADISTSNIGGPVRGISMDRDRIYVADEWGVKIYSMENPAKPELLVFHQLYNQGFGQFSCTSDIAVRDGIAYIAFEFRGIEIYDLNDLGKARYCGSYPETEEKGFITNIHFEGNLAFAKNNNRMELLDITDLWKPKYLSGIDNFTAQSNNFRGGVNGNTAFFPNDSNGILAVELSNTSEPKVRGTIDTAGIPVNINIKDNLGYVSDSLGGINVINLSQEELSVPSLDAKQTSSNRITCSYDLTIFRGEKAEKYVLSGKKAEEALNKAGKSFTETLTVSNTKESGTGSFTWCVDHVKKGGRILFDPKVFPPSKPATIYSTGVCLNRVDNITIDASNAGVILDGSRAGENAMGINILSDGNVIRGLQIQNFRNSSVYIGSSNNILGGSRSKGKGPTGEGNVMINCGGIGIYGQNATDNIIVGNNIGVKADGITPAANMDGISLRTMASRNTIGIDKPEYRNLISANKNNGISSMGEAFGNLIEGNYIGTDITGMEELGNNNHGISSELCGGFGNIIKANVICGNGRYGILLWDNRASYNVIIGNKSGIGVDGSKELPNKANSGMIGGGVGGGSFYNVIGGKGDYGNILYKPQFGLDLEFCCGIYDTIFDGVVYKHMDSERY